VSTSSSSSNGTALVAQQNYIDRTSTTMWNGSMVSGGQSISATPSVWSATSTEILSTSAIDGVINATLSAMPTLGTISRSETQLIFTYTKSGTVDVVTSANMTMTDIHTVALVSGGQIKANEPTTLYYKPDNVSQPAFWQPLTPIDQQYLVISNPQDLKVIGNTAIMTLTQDVAQLQNIIISRSRSVDISQVIGVGVSETATIAAQGVVISTSAAQTQTITTKNYQASMVPTRTIIKDQQFYIPITIGVDYSLPPLGKQFTMTVGVEGGAWVHNIDRQYQRNQTAPQYYTGNITTINFQQNSNSFRVTDINTATSRQQQLLLASGSISQLENQQQTASTSITYRANQAAVETTVIGSNFSRIYDINVGTAPAVIGIAN
ncbi:MAG: hypothetical protein ORN57_00315, partial [Alphaproteobacteria bacterium]|nr:hypothetical protein [Alphaproteobacteria bacterium]